MKQHVHIYAVVRVKVSDIDAETPKAAIKKAEEEADLQKLLTFNGADLLGVHMQDVDVTYAEEHTGYTVAPLDEDGEIMYDQVKNFEVNEIDS